MVMLHHMAIGQLVTPILVCSLLHGSNSETNQSYIGVAVSGELFPINGLCDPMNVFTCEPQFEATGVGK